MDGASELPDRQSAEVFARVNRLELRVDELDQLFPVPRHAPVPSGGEDEAPLAEWVATFLAGTFARSLGGEHRWCSRWEAHPEAVFRLRALRRAQVVLRADSAMGDAIWLRDHLDPQLTALLSSRGTFAFCSRDRHDLLPPLPVDTLSEAGVQPMLQWGPHPGQ